MSILVHFSLSLILHSLVERSGDSRTVSRSNVAADITGTVRNHRGNGRPETDWLAPGKPGQSARVRVVEKPIPRALAALAAGLAQQEPVDDAMGLGVVQIIRSGRATGSEDPILVHIAGLREHKRVSRRAVGLVMGVQARRRPQVAELIQPLARLAVEAAAVEVGQQDGGCGGDVDGAE